MEHKSFKAEILTISDDVRTKSNGKQYLVTTVKFLDGPLTGKSYFAQRTLGENKATVQVGQAVTAHLSVVDNKPFFEISTGSSVNSAEELMALLA
jgi:hypothetical protein